MLAQIGREERETERERESAGIPGGKSETSNMNTCTLLNIYRNRFSIFNIGMKLQSKPAQWMSSATFLEGRVGKCPLSLVVLKQDEEGGGHFFVYFCADKCRY